MTGRGQPVYPTVGTSPAAVGFWTSVQVGGRNFGFSPFTRSSRRPASFERGTMNSQSHLCKGFPAGHNCPVFIPLDRLYCYSCQPKAYAMSKEGMPSDWEPVGTVLGENKTCACGGNPFGYDHAHSLGHVEWAWRNGYAEKQDIDVAPYVPGRWN